MSHKTAGEDFTEIMREFLRIPCNKFCFECGQRGPTYVNVSNGSFCCTNCSGLLRGLNPPRRVKSISLSNFTKDEISNIRRMGNEENEKIWLGLCDTRIKFEPRIEEEVKQHLIQKYEEKRWYVSREELEEQKRLLENIADEGHKKSPADTNLKAQVDFSGSQKVQEQQIHTIQSNNLISTDALKNSNNTENNTGLIDILTDDFFQPTECINKAKSDTSSLIVKVPDDSLNLNDISDLFGNLVPRSKSSRAIKNTSSPSVSNETENINSPFAKFSSPTPKTINENKSIVMLPDGRPVMSKNENSSNYSALEEIFSGPSYCSTDDHNKSLSNVKNISVQWDSFGPNLSTGAPTTIHHRLPDQANWNPFL